MPAIRRFPATAFVCIWLFATLGVCDATGSAAAETEVRTWTTLADMSRGMRLNPPPPPREIEYSEIRFQSGDDSRWADPDYDDRGWRVLTRESVPGLPARFGIGWVRYQVRWNGSEGRLPNGVGLLWVEASYEIYWDGVLLGRSGVPGHSVAEEKPGLTRNWFQIPESLLGPGPHTVALRLSNHRAGRPVWFMPLQRSVDEMYARWQHSLLLPLGGSAVMFTVAVASLVLWLVTERRRMALLFGGLFLSAGLTEALWCVRSGFSIPYPWLKPLTTATQGAACAKGFLLVGLALSHLKPPRPRTWFAGVLFLQILIWVAWLTDGMWTILGLRRFGLTSTLIGGPMIVVLACCAWAAWRRRQGAVPLGLGVAVSTGCWLHQPLDFIGRDFLLEFLPTLLGLLTAISLRLRDERRQAQAATRTAARLELELLRKNLQPHFLMNTLTALAQVVEENPALAARLIDDLAELLQSLSRLASERQVPLACELELCRAHLRVMSARTEIDWQLDATAADLETPVPPALFLTLIENGFSHQRVEERTARFVLNVESGNGRVRCTFVSPGSVAPDHGRTGGGTGLRYVRARLEELSPGDWHVTQAAVPGGWQTELDFSNHAQPAIAQ